jgi:uncharacterized protein YcfL
VDNLGIPPLKTCVDTADGNISFPWQQWFSALHGRLFALFGALGLQYLNNAYSSVSCTSTQVAVANTATKITLDTASLSNGLTLASNAVTAAQAGYYQVNLQAQCTNAAATVQQVFLWVRKNGVDLASSGAVASINPIAGAMLGYTFLISSLIVSLSAGDYLEFYWAADNVNAKLTARAVQAAPFAMPAVPAFAVSMTLVSAP